jgi:hypothetical protein
MPRFRNKGDVNIENFIKELSDELSSSAQPTPADPFALAGDKPVIFETPTGIGERFRVTVVWDKWGGLAVEDRNRIIMEAYRRVLGPQAVNIGMTLGITRLQHQKMGTVGAALGL